MSEYLDDMTAVRRFTSVMLASFAGNRAAAGGNGDL